MRARSDQPGIEEEVVAKLPVCKRAGAAAPHRNNFKLYWLFLYKRAKQRAPVNTSSV